MTGCPYCQSQDVKSLLDVFPDTYDRIFMQSTIFNKKTEQDDPAADVEVFIFKCNKCNGTFFEIDRPDF